MILLLLATRFSNFAFASRSWSGKNLMCSSLIDTRLTKCDLKTARDAAPTTPKATPANNIHGCWCEKRAR